MDSKTTERWESPGADGQQSFLFESIGNGEVRITITSPDGAAEVSTIGLGEVNDLKRFLMRVERDA